MNNFIIPSLPYSADALEPVISRQTIELHYGAHTKSYFDNLNKLIADYKLQNLSLDEIICNADGPIFNNAAQAWNHVFYFNSFSLNGGGSPGPKLNKAIKQYFGSFDRFKAEFVEKGSKIFGSGWIWLARDFEGQLIIVPKTNAGNPMTDGLTPLLTFDVWEHAYYLDYKNKRADYLNALWNIIDWKVIEDRY